jgi:CubicO group peptidase (beta-lactamase class C family)
MLMATPVDWKSRINKVVQRHINEERNVGVVVGVMKDGNIWVNGFGQTHLTRPSAPTEHTIFEIGSVSKVFTGLALGRLVVDGTVHLEDSIAMHLPELVGTAAGAITFRELTTHTSGLPCVPSNLTRSDPTNPYKDYQIDDLMTFLKSFQFEHPKPFPFEYSNLGVGLLGYVLSQVCGDDYDGMIRTLITRPLGMTDTGVVLTTSQLQRTAQGYYCVPDESPLWDLSVLAGAGGVRASLHDMMIFLKANLVPETTPFSSAIKLSQQIQAPGPTLNVGLGWIIWGSGDDAMRWHNGQTGGFHSHIAFKPSEQTGVVMLTNTASDVQCLSDIAFGKDCEPKHEYQHTELQLQRFLGKYDFGDGDSAEVTRHNSFLVIQITGQPKYRLSAVSKGKFGGGMFTFSFVTDETGGVDRLVLCDEGLDYIAKKVNP